MRAFVDAGAVVGITRALVAVDTQNPPGGERAAIGVARDLLAPLGAAFEEVEPAPGRSSLLATIGDGDGRRATLLVNGHLDVVPVDRAGWTRDPFGGEVADGRVYGRGTADMKGGIAAAIEAVAALGRSGREPAGDLVFHLVADEEQGGALGTGTLVAEGRVRAHACLVPEPTGLALCIAERGLLNAVVTVHGRPAHGSEPRRGISAIEKAAKIVLALHAADFGGPAHPRLGRPTCNVGVIDGGSSANIVASSCRVEVNRRVLPGVTRADAEAELRARIDAIDDPELAYDMETLVFGEASELEPGHPFVRRLQVAMTAVLGAPQPLIGMPFATDARFVRNQAGIPAVVCGPGDLAQAHAHDESVSVERLVDAAAVYAELFATFAV